MILGLAIGFWLGVIWTQWAEALYEPKQGSQTDNFPANGRQRIVDGEQYRRFIRNG